LLDEIKAAVLSDRPADMPDRTSIDYGGAAAEEGVYQATGDSRGSSERVMKLIRVDASKVDELLNLAGEMMIVRSALEQASREVETKLCDEELSSRLSRSVARLEGLITKFQKVSLKMRMVPVEMLFRRYNRAIRDLASELGKSVDLVVGGEKTELDRNLVELLYEPILHLLRNALDHGIEPAEERVRSGKRETGIIRMHASYNAEEVVLKITDDGRGLDLDALRQGAFEAGHLSAHEFSDEDSARLVFADGVTTARTVTKVSGRGIGGAAVKTMIDKVRGAISVKTEQGKGTTFILRVPLTLAIMRSLLYSAGGRLFALPLAAVRETAKFDYGSVAVICGVEWYQIRGHLLPIVKPCLPSEDAAQLEPGGEVCEYLIIVSSGGREFAITSESVLGVRELVVKPLIGRWTESRIYIGAAVLGTGEVVFIQDVGAMYEKAVNENRYEGASELEYAR
jgi:two-component system chemotaxis sensor kinase CheA